LDKDGKLKDDISSESSMNGETSYNNPLTAKFKYFDFSQFLENNYKAAFSRFEQAARARNHVVDNYNFNP
jgi:hypothetical protein